MGVVINFNKAKAKLKKKALTFKPTEECAVPKEKDYFEGTEFEEVRRGGKIIIRLRKEYRK